MVVERSGSYYRVTAEAPYGYIWTASGTHELVADGRGPYVAEAKRDITERIALGVEPCTDEDCDWCQSE